MLFKDFGNGRKDLFTNSHFLVIVVFGTLDKRYQYLMLDENDKRTLGVFRVNADLPFFFEPPVRASISCLSPLRTATAASTSVDAAPLVRNCLMVPSWERISSARTSLQSDMLVEER